MNKPAGNSRREHKPTGSYVTVSTFGAGRVRAFIPAPLPPGLEVSPALRRAFDAALLALGRGAGSAARVVTAFRGRPLWTVGRLKEATGLSVPTVTRAIAALQDLGIVRETTGRRRGRVFCYDACLRVLSEGTEPL